MCDTYIGLIMNASMDLGSLGLHMSYNVTVKMPTLKHVCFDVNLQIDKKVIEH